MHFTRRASDLLRPCPFLGIWIAVLIALLPPIVFAEEATLPEPANPADLTQLSLEQLMALEVEQVYSATRYSQRVIDAPSSTTVITAEEIRRFGHRTLADVLNSVRGFVSTSDRNYNYTTARGFGRPGDYDSRILVLVDGVRVNEPVYDSPGTGTDFILDIALADRIEIIRGPGSALYGTNAVFAVVNIITRKGEELRGAEISAEAQRFDAYRGRVSAGSTWGEDGGVIVSATGFSSHGDSELQFPEFISEDSDGIARNNDADEFGSLFFSASRAGLSFQAAYVDRKKQLSTAPYGTILDEDRAQTIDRRAYGALTYEGELSSELSLLLRTSYSWYEYEGFYPYASEEGDSFDSVLNRDFTRGETWANEIQLTAQLADWNRLVTGFEYRDNFNLDQQNYNEFPYELFSDDRRSQEIWALYLQDEIRLADWARLTLGVRHDDYSLVGGTTNPRAGLVLLPQQNFAVKLLYGTAFRAPNAYELFYDDIADINKPNPNLDPEEIETWEIVGEYYFSKNSRLVANAFWYEIDDLISSGVDPADGQIVSTNGSGASAAGAAIEFSATSSEGWFLRTSYGFVETEDSGSGMQLSNSPRHVAKAFFSVPLAERLYLSPGVRFVSERGLSDDSSKRVASCFTVDTTILQEDILPGLSLAGSVYNLLDRNCRDPVGAEISQGAIAQDGRVFRAELRWKFGGTNTNQNN